MTGNPWDKFFWNDWETDPALRLCSLAAQGLWMRMLCLAAKAAPVGHVKVGGTPCTAADLARLVGESEETVTSLLSELERASVYSRTRTGTIYSRRMVRDAKRRETNRENGKKGGSATYGKQRGIFQSPKRHSERSTERPPEPHKPEAISQKPDSKRQRLVEVAARAVTSRWPLPVWNFAGQDVADAWAADGIGEQAVHDAAERICTREFAAGNQPPRSLRYLDQAVRAVAAKDIADGRYLASLGKQKDAYVAAVERWERDGCQGDPPRPENFRKGRAA